MLKIKNIIYNSTNNSSNSSKLINSLIKRYIITTTPISIATSNIINNNSSNNIINNNSNQPTLEQEEQEEQEQQQHSVTFDNITIKNRIMGPLTEEELKHFNEYGYVIKNGIIEDELLTRHQIEIREFIKKNAGIELDTSKYKIGSKEESQYLASQENKLSNVSNGFGGMINFYHGKCEYEIRQHQKLYECFVQLYESTYSNTSKLIYNDENEWANEYGSFDPRHMYMFVNRCGFRVPSLSASTLTSNSNSNSNSTSTSTSTLENQQQQQQITKTHQKSTGLHLDCNPFHLFRGERINKEERKIEHIPLRFWQPIQAFVSCSNTVNINEGGFWTVPKFHKRCVQYFRKYPQDNSLNKIITESDGTIGLKRGNAFDFQDNKYLDVIESLQFIPIKRGDVIFWDWRLPHTNDISHTGNSVREVVYSAHLPMVPINELYAETQKNWYYTGKHPDYVAKKFANLETINYIPPSLSPLGYSLLKIKPWSD